MKLTETLRAIVPSADDAEPDLAALKFLAREAMDKMLERSGATAIGEVTYNGVFTEPLVLDEGEPAVDLAGITLHAFEIQADVSSRDAFRSGGQTYETPRRPSVSVPRPNPSGHQKTVAHG